MLTNRNNVALSLAVWLAHDDYDHQPGKVSVTSLIKPLKQYLMSREAAVQNMLPPIDIASLLKSKMGTALHNDMEYVWKNHHVAAMTKLGYTPDVIEKVLINPEESELFDGCIPVYLEQREERKVGGTTVTGKFDMVANGTVRDTKSTSAYVYMNDTKRDAYQLQGSIYRWLNPEKITDSSMVVDFIITDYAPGMNKGNPAYPEHGIPSKQIPLLSLDDTEKYIKNKINEISKYPVGTPESKLPPCTAEDLWQGDSVFKYYADPNKTSGRATKNFDYKIDADKHRIAKGRGVVLEVKGKAKACHYCNGFLICDQKDSLVRAGLLEL